MCAPIMIEKFLTVNVNNVTKKEKYINKNVLFISQKISMLILYKKCMFQVVVLERRHGYRSINTV